jgi:hypothetical protein
MPVLGSTSEADDAVQEVIRLSRSEQRRSDRFGPARGRREVLVTGAGL